MQQIATFSSLDLERWSERFFNQESNCVLLMKRDTAEGGQGSQEGADGIFFFFPLEGPERFVLPAEEA